MSRKRKSDQPSSESVTVTTEPPVGNPPAAGVVDTPAAANDNLAAANDNRPSFAERVGQKQRVMIPDPFGIASDSLAGVRLFESRQDRQMAIKFGDGGPDSKPSQPVINKMKEAGYRWDPVDRVWTHPVRADSAMSTRIEAEQLFQEVRKMIRHERGIAPDQEVPF